MSYIVKDHWRIDKRVPPALLLALLLQIAFGLIWAAQLDARVARIEKDIEYIRGRLDFIGSH